MGKPFAKGRSELCINPSTLTFSNSERPRNNSRVSCGIPACPSNAGRISSKTLKGDFDVANLRRSKRWRILAAERTGFADGEKGDQHGAGNREERNDDVMN